MSSITAGSTASTAWRSPGAMPGGALVARAGLEPVEVTLRPMALLEPRRLVADEGLGRMARVLVNALRDPVARRRVLDMRRAFRRHREELAAISLVARRPEADPA